MLGAKLLSVLPLLLTAGCAAAVPAVYVDVEERATSCATGVHIIVARASTEPQGEGIIGAVATQVKNRVPGSDSVAVVYPATLTNYTSSESQGVAAMTKLIQNYAVACPKSKIVLMGYSQGAQVSLDTLCGTSENGFNTTAALAAQYAQKIVAIISMGDPTHIPGLSYDVGTSVRDGIFPRQNTAACASQASKIQTYCDTGDVYCDSGNNSSVHTGYVQEYGTAAANFVVSKATSS